MEPINENYGVVDAGSVRACMARIAASETFQQSGRLTRFLEFVVEESLEGRGASLKETLVGMAVFERKPDYDPKSDPIVRVQARRLRSKLEEYFSGQGAAEAIRIELPRGGYAPLFKPAEAPRQTSEAPIPHRHQLLWVGAGILALVAVGIYFASRGTQPFSLGQVRPFTNYPGYQSYPAFSPDGQNLAFAWDGPQKDNTDIYVQALDADAPTRLTRAPAAESRPAWHPQQQRIAFTRWAGAGRFQILDLPLAGTGERKLAEVAGVQVTPPHLSWSPDGKWIYTNEVDAARGVSRLVRIDLQSGAKEWLTDPPAGSPGDTEVSVSADGKRIAFQRNREEAIANLYTASAEGKELVPVTKDATGIIGLAWAYGGKAILASTRWKSSLQRLWWIPLDGNVPTALTDPALAASWPAVSPRDGRIAYASRMFDTNVWRFDVQGSEAPRRVVASNVLDSGARLSPDGQRIAFRSNRGGNDEIWTSNREGEAVARLSKFGGPTTGSPYWSPDGKHLLLESRAGGKAGIYEVNAEGGPLRHLSGNAFDEVLPRYSRDGRSIYFATNRGGSWQIWKRKREGGGDEQVTRGGGLAGYESDDGAYLYFSKRNEQGIYRVSLQGGAEELVFDGLANGMWGAWGLAGQRILYVSLNPPALQEYDLKTKSRRTITVFDSAPVRFDSSVSVSPDGHWALISLVERAGSTLYVEQKAETAN